MRSHTNNVIIVITTNTSKSNRIWRKIQKGIPEKKQPTKVIFLGITKARRCYFSEWWVLPSSIFVANVRRKAPAATSFAVLQREMIKETGNDLGRSYQPLQTFPNITGRTECKQAGNEAKKSQSRMRSLLYAKKTKKKKDSKQGLPRCWETTAMVATGMELIMC